MTLASSEITISEQRASLARKESECDRLLKLKDQTQQAHIEMKRQLHAANEENEALRETCSTYKDVDAMATNFHELNLMKEQLIGAMTDAVRMQSDNDRFRDLYECEHARVEAYVAKQDEYNRELSILDCAFKDTLSKLQGNINCITTFADLVHDVCKFF